MRPMLPSRAVAFGATLLFVLAALPAFGPAEATANPITVVAFGDVGLTGNSSANVRLAASEGTSGYLGLGDYNYAASPSAWKTLMGPLLAPGAWLTLGNHDNLADFTSMMPGGNPQWSILLGGARVISINTEARIDVGTSQYNWLVGQLQQPEPMKVVVMHKPWWLQSGAQHPGSQFFGSPSAMDALMAKYHVALVLSGHEHNYQRSVRSGVTYDVVGTGGESLYPLAGLAIGTVATCECYGHLLLTLSSTGASAKMMDINARQRDSFTVTAPTIVPPPPSGNSSEFWAREGEAFASHSTGGQVSGSQYSAGAAWNLWTNGNMTDWTNLNASRNATLTIRAVGTLANGTGPVMSAQIAGATVARWNVSSTLQNYTVSVNIAAGLHSVRLWFTNDAVINGQDRNLIVDRVSLSS